MIDQSLFKKKKLYPFQKEVVDVIIAKLDEKDSNYNLLFQLPTGGGKTVIFSNIAKDYIKAKKKKVKTTNPRLRGASFADVKIILTSLNANNKILSKNIVNVVNISKEGYNAAKIKTQKFEKQIKKVGILNILSKSTKN